MQFEKMNTYIKEEKPSEFLRKSMANFLQKKGGITKDGIHHACNRARFFVVAIQS